VESTKSPPLFTNLMKWFMFAMILANIASSMFNMLLPLHVTALGGSIEQVGIVFTISAAASLIFQVIGGWISDMIGRLKAIAIGSIGGVIGLFFIAFVPTWEWLIVAMIVSRIPYALVGPSFGAFIAENSTEENRGRMYGITDTLFQITGIIGPPLGGFLMGFYDFKTMMIISASLYTVAAGLRIWMAKTKMSDEEKKTSSSDLTAASFKKSASVMLKMMFAGGIVTWIFVTDGIQDIAFRLSLDIQPLYLEQVGGISVEQIGILGAIFSFAMMFTPILSGKLSDKYGERIPISAGFAFLSISFIVFLSSISYIVFILSWIFAGMGIGLLSPAYQSYISKIIPQNMLGMFSGIFRGSIGLISLPAPYFGALLWEKFTPQTPFIITTIIITMAIIPAWFIFKPIIGKVDLGVDLGNES